MGAPELTVCIPTFDRCGFLRECLSALVDQGLGAGEFVVAISDNASTDDTPEVVKSFDSRLQIDYRRNPTTVSAVDNLDAALGLARTRYAALLCDDDLVTPGQFGRALRCLRAFPDACLYAALGSGQSRFGDPLAQPLGSFLGVHPVEPFLFRLSPVAWLANCSLYTPMTVIGSVFLRERLPEAPIFRPEFPTESDRLLFMEMAGRGEIYSSPWLGGQLRYHGGQQTLRNEGRHDETRRVTLAVLAHARELGHDLVAFWAGCLPELSHAELRWVGKLMQRRYPKPLTREIFARAGIGRKDLRRRRRTRSPFRSRGPEGATPAD